jgi:hypothetical protein
MMRWCLLHALLSATAIASPSVAVVNSCLQNRAQFGVMSTGISNQEILKENNYKLGHDAEYLKFEDKDIGFATERKAVPCYLMANFGRQNSWSFYLAQKNRQTKHPC